MTAPSTAQWLALLEANLQPLEEELAGKAFKGLIYGPSGVGKTVQAVKLAQVITPPNKTILYLDSGNGWVSLSNHEGARVRVNRLKLGMITTLEGIARLIREKQGEFANVGCVIVDEYSTIVDNDLSMIVAERAKKDNTKDPDTGTMPDFNTSKARGVKYINGLFLLDGVHVIVIAHERVDKDASNITVVSPLFNPKLGARIREAVHLVGYMSMSEVREEGDSTKKKLVRNIQVHPSKTVIAKTRIGGLAPVVSFEALSAVIKEWSEVKNIVDGTVEVPAVEAIPAGIPVLD